MQRRSFVTGIAAAGLLHSARAQDGPNGRPA
jgi:hypothetical protein